MHWHGSNDNDTIIENRRNFVMKSLSCVCVCAPAYVCVCLCCVCTISLPSILSFTFQFSVVFWHETPLTSCINLSGARGTHKKECTVYFGFDFDHFVLLGSCLSLSFTVMLDGTFNTGSLYNWPKEQNKAHLTPGLLVIRSWCMWMSVQRVVQHIQPLPHTFRVSLFCEQVISIIIISVCLETLISLSISALPLLSLPNARRISIWLN